MGGAVVNKSDTKFFFLSIGIGLALGVAAGMLFAPASGEKTRRSLRKKAEKGERYLAELRRAASEIRKQVAKLR
jgi:gas vesicle protein